MRIRKEYTNTCIFQWLLLLNLGLCDILCILYNPVIKENKLTSIELDFKIISALELGIELSRRLHS